MVKLGALHFPWQPIETFFERDDHTGAVLIYIPGWGVTLANCEFGGGYIWKTGNATFRGGDKPHDPTRHENAPTHWMPLPPPPAAEG